MGSCASSDTLKTVENCEERFELLKVIGKGGFAHVQAAISYSRNQVVAIKRISKIMILKSKNRLDMIFNEKLVMTRIRSPFLCHAFCTFQSDAELYIVMPFMEGGDLRYHLAIRGKMDENQLRFYAAEILLGIEALHRNHVIFRDLKPENLLLDAHGHLHLTDFGLSITTLEEMEHLAVGRIGTHGYQAPEMLNSLPYSNSVDIFAYGVTLYELGHGIRPWTPGWLKNVSRNNDIDFASLSEFYISSRFGPSTQAFLRGLLALDCRKRLGCGLYGLEEIKRHQFFAGIDWDLVAAKAYAPPLIPDNTVLNFDADLEKNADSILLTPCCQRDQQIHFVNWDSTTRFNLKEKNCDLSVNITKNFITLTTNNSGAKYVKDSKNIDVIPATRLVSQTVSRIESPMKHFGPAIGKRFIQIFKKKKDAITNWQMPESVCRLMNANCLRHNQRCYCHLSRHRLKKVI